jgi:hypothetical protein
MVPSVAPYGLNTEFPTLPARYDGLPSGHLQSRPGLARQPAEGSAIWLLEVSMSGDGSAAMAYANQLDPQL